MKILLAGGSTGGHFYPLIAVAGALYEKSKARKMISPEIWYMAPSKYNPRALFDNDIQYIYIPAGKIRRYFSILNFIDLFKTFYGCLMALFEVWKLYPDVIFGKGGYASFPAILAGRILGIPVIIHESDSAPGKVNAWAGKFARKIAISYPDAAQYFPKNKVAVTGNPIRKEIEIPLTLEAHSALGLDPSIPTILILGGSQGARAINDVIIDSLPELLKTYQVIHQTGKNNFLEVTRTAGIILEKNELAKRYKPMEYLNDLTMRQSAGVSFLIISRAGSTIFEIAAWKKPSIIIPISQKVSHDQTKNAFSYARSGACKVIEEHNLSETILLSEINKIYQNKEEQERMIQAAGQFSKLDAADKIADAMLDIIVEHES